MELSLPAIEDQLYLGHIQGACLYLPGHEQSLLFLDGRGVGQVYRLLLDAGYRRHGMHLYRPDCLSCSECRVLRIPVARFEPTRSQRRVWKRGQSMFRHELGEPEYSREKLELYERYLAHQHKRTEKKDEALSAAHYREFFVDSFLAPQTRELRIYVRDPEEPAAPERLAGVAILDQAGDALSAVYFFFDPDCARHSPGTYAILLEIELAKEMGLRYFYPGFYIPGCAAMAYKANFGPHEIRTPGERHWIPGAEFRQKIAPDLKVPAEKVDIENVIDNS